MKAIILIYCGPDGDAGKLAAAPMRKSGDRVMLRDAATFNRDVEACDKIVIMPDVAAFHRDRLIAAYGLCKVIGPVAEPAQEPKAKTGIVPLIAKHRGRGRWFVMRGDEIVSGPHTRDEAQRLAA